MKSRAKDASRRSLANAEFFLAFLILGVFCERGDTQNIVKSSDPSDIVVTGRRSRGIEPKDVINTVPAETIKAYGADSIGDLLARLGTRFGPNFSILVNGRRLAGVEAINALPPEALEKIELLKPSKANDYSLPANKIVVNLALRAQFHFLTAEGGGSVTTEGNGDTENATLRYSRIRRDKRLNIAVAYSRQGGLLESDRAQISGGDRDWSAAFRSLTPRQDAVTLTAGYALPLGGLNLDLSSAASLVQTSALTGLISTSADGSGTSSLGKSDQNSEARSLRTAATVSGFMGRYFWTLLLTNEMSRTTINNRFGQLVEVGSGATGTTTILGPNTISRVESSGATATFSGPLLGLPAGSITLDGSFGVKRNSLISTVENSSSTRVVDRYTSATAQGGITIPLASKSSGGLSFLGNLSAGQRFAYVRDSGIGDVLTTTDPVPENVSVWNERFLARSKLKRVGDFA